MNITVRLLHVTPLEILVSAIRQCYESQDKSDSVWKKVSPEIEGYYLGEKDKDLINRITADGHGSTLEHIAFNFQIKGISRLNLQELARHRMASLSVKSTRYTLKLLKNESSFFYNKNNDAMLPVNGMERASKYINMTGIEQIDIASVHALENLVQLIQAGYTNDQAKYALPECFKTDLYWTINARSLTNFLQLRLSPRAHFEIRELSNLILQSIPVEYRFLFNI
jgi:thymidylate synthase (FAD)